VQGAIPAKKKPIRKAGFGGSVKRAVRQEVCRDLLDPVVGFELQVLCRFEKFGT